MKYNFHQYLSPDERNKTDIIMARTLGIAAMFSVNCNYFRYFYLIIKARVKQINPYGSCT